MDNERHLFLHSLGRRCHHRHDVLLDCVLIAIWNFLPMVVLRLAVVVVVVVVVVVGGGYTRTDSQILEISQESRKVRNACHIWPTTDTRNKK